MSTYDAEAAAYDSMGYPTTSHDRFVARLLDTCPPGGVVLDAPCGTGKYFANVAASGRQVVGDDQSAGMLEQARRGARGSRTGRSHLAIFRSD
jgi:ubiquinone/menaquinone biosynthesis C-methylase UbiE